MTWNECHVVTQGEKPRPDRIQQDGQVTVRMVPSSDLVAEQDIADESLPGSAAEVSDVPLAMARTMQHFELLFAETDGVSMFEPAQWLVAADCPPCSRLC